MARGLEEDRSRRRGRVEMLLTELEQLPGKYQPEEREAALFASLAAQIGKVFKVGKDPELQAAPEAPEKKGKDK